MAIKRSDPAGEDEEMRALAREVGRRSADRLEAGLSQMTTDSSATGRWILGSLVTLNGGGIVAMATSHDAFGREVIAFAAYFFVFGATIAVLAALVSMFSRLALSKDFGEANTLWTQVGLTGEISESAMASANKLRRKGLIWSMPPIVLGLISLLFFMTGAMTLADGLSGPSPQQAVSPAEAALAKMQQAPANAASGISAPAKPGPVGPAIAPPTSAPAATLVAPPTPQRRPPTRRAPSQPAASAPTQAPAPSSAPAASPPATTTP